MKTVSRNNLEIDYHIYGQEGPWLLFVHGSFNDQTYWDKQVNFLKDKYRVITMDLGGHGKSGKNRKSWTIEEFGLDVVELIKQLNLRNVILIGHSLGADAAVEAAIQLPDFVAGLIAVDYFKNVGVPFPEEQAKQIIENLHTDFANTSETYARTGLLTAETPELITEKIVKAYRNAYPDMGVKSIESLFGYYKREPELLKKLKVKLHLINVDYMPTNEEPLKKFVNSYDVHAIRGTSHFPMIENPVEFNHILEQAIAEITNEVIV